MPAQQNSSSKLFLEHPKSNLDSNANLCGSEWIQHISNPINCIVEILGFPPVDWYSKFILPKLSLNMKSEPIHIELTPCRVSVCKNPNNFKQHQSHHMMRWSWLFFRLNSPCMTTRTPSNPSQPHLKSTVNWIMVRVAHSPYGGKVFLCRIMLDP